VATRKRRPPNPAVWRLAAVAIFAIAMGHFEATVVVYIRAILDVIPTPEQLDAATMRLVPGWVIASEQAREAATIVMLVTLAYLAGRSIYDRLGVFVYAFGIWDIFYYVALKAMIDWPSSLGTMDCLFLVPRPWFGPVWLPVAISGGLIATGLGLMSWQERVLVESRKRPRRPSGDPSSADETVEMSKVK
jgi:hypothetical protein